MSPVFLIQLLVALIYPTTIFLVCFIYWKRNGKEKTITQPLIAQYEPPEALSTAEMDVMLKGAFQEKDLAATLIDLTIRKYISIEEIDHQFVLHKQKDPDTSLRPFEAILLHAIFGKKITHVTIRPKTKVLSGAKKKMQSALFHTLTEKGYYTKNPEEIFKTYILYAFFSAFVGFFFNMFWFFVPPILQICSTAFGAIIILLFSKIMPQKTQKGTKVTQAITGFKLFLETTEKDRAKFQEQQGYMETYLPYAMSFDLATKWTEAFPDLASWKTKTSTAFTTSIKEALR